MTTHQTSSRYANKSLPQSPPIPHSNTTAKSQGNEEWHGRTAGFLAAAPEIQPAAAGRTSSDLATTFRHSHWAPQRRKVEAVMKSTPEISHRRLTAFQCCGADAYVEQSSPDFSPYASMQAGISHLVMQKNPRYRLRSTKCHDRFCTPCSQERSFRIRTSLLNHMFKRRNLSIITLTLEHDGKPLAERMDRLTKCFRLLRNKPLWKKNVPGGVSIIENKVSSKTGGWHCHYHIVAEAKYMPQKELSAAWYGVTGDSYIVDVRRVGAMTGAVQYITKYITKGTDPKDPRDPEKLREEIIAFTGRRLVSTFGTWRGLQLMEKPDERKENQAVAKSWSRVGSLDDVMRSAAAGDATCLAIMFAIAPKKFATGRPQPPPEEPV